MSCLTISGMIALNIREDSEQPSNPPSLETEAALLGFFHEEANLLLE